MRHDTRWAEALGGWQGFTTVWAEAMGRVCLEGTLVLCCAFLLTRLFGKVQASVRCWIWRLAFLKLSLLFLCLTTIGLPVLPPNSMQATSPLLSSPGMGTIGTNPPNITIPAAPSSLNVQAEAMAISEASGGKVSALGILRSALAGLWCVGVLFGLVRIARQYREAMALVQSACPITDSVILAEFLQASHVMGLKRRPELAVSDLTDVPLFFGLVRPIVILPAAIVADFSPEEYRMMLAHELAHMKRRDLAWSFLTGLAEVLFFFHPLVWWGHRELRTVQEICCDETAIRSVAVTAHTYGSVLVRVAARQTTSRQDGLSAVAMAESFHTIERRLKEMERFRIITGWKRWAPAAVAVVGGMALLPWQLEAQPGAPLQGGATSAENPKPTEAPKQKESPKSTDKRSVKAGDYTLTIVDPNKKTTSDENFRSGDDGSNFTFRSSAGDASGAASGSGGGSFGPGGSRSFRSNLSLALDVAGRSKEALLLIDGVANLRGEDDRGRAVHGPESPSIAMPTLPSLLPEGPKREMLNLQTEDGAKSLKTLEGDLLVINGAIRTIEFPAAEMRSGASKKIGRVSVTIDSAKETENGYEVSIAFEAPQGPSPRNAQEMMVRMMQGDRNLDVELLGTDGVSYRSGMTGSGSGEGGTFLLGGDAKDDAAPPKLVTRHQNLAFARMPEGVRPKTFVFRVMERQGASRRVPFKFTEVPLGDKR